MELTLRRLTRKQQVTVALGGSVALVVCVHLFWVTPVQAANALQRQALAALRSDIARARTTERTLPEVRRLRDGLQARVAALHAMVLRESEVAAVLRDAQAMAESAELWITGFKPAPALAGEHGMERSVTLEFDGTYAALVRFLQAMSDYPRLVTVTALRLRAADRPADGATLTGSCRLTAFISNEAPEATRREGDASTLLWPSNDEARAAGEREATPEALP